MNKKRAIVWFRQDLRLHDNEALIDALTTCEEVVPVFVFDERVFSGKTSFGFKKTAKYRAKFILESILDLKQNLQRIGSDLYIRVGKPEEIIFELADQIKTNWVFCNRERTAEEVAVQNALETKLWSIGQELRYYRGKMLLYTSDLPFPVTQTPEGFTNFRKEVENFVEVRSPLDAPTEPFHPVSKRIDYGEIPTLNDLGYDDFETEPFAVFDFKGGETAALRRLQEYIWEGQYLASFKETRNQLLGANFSTKFSAYLAQGCLSPKMIYSEVKKYESIYGSNDSTYWLIFELLWRDFFRFMGKKHENKIFQLFGTDTNKDVTDLIDFELFDRWANGTTGIPFIDANMRELNRTGYMSNRGRLNVSSFLINDLKLNWLMGAEYFESLLIDYDPCSNYGNWNNIAGVGCDPRHDRYFNILSQAKRYDPEGMYVKHWIPELYEIPASVIHQPEQWPMMKEFYTSYYPSSTYPKPIIASGNWN